MAHNNSYARLSPRRMSAFLQPLAVTWIDAPTAVAVFRRMGRIGTNACRRQNAFAGASDSVPTSEGELLRERARITPTRLFLVLPRHAQGDFSERMPFCECS